MSSHDLTMVGYGLIALIGAAAQVLAWSGRSRIPTMGAVLARVMRTRSGRMGVMAGWAWFGMHFFVR